MNRLKRRVEMMYGFGWLTWVLILIFLLLLIGGVVALIVLLARQGPDTQARPAGEDEPLRILRERYARGEITREEFLAIRDDLAQ
jgi:putative membrane protein